MDNENSINETAKQELLFHADIVDREFGSALLNVVSLLDWANSKGLHLVTKPPIEGFKFVQVEALLCAIERASFSGVTEPLASAIVGVSTTLADDPAADIAPGWLIGADAHRQWREVIGQAVQHSELTLLDFGSKLPIGGVTSLGGIKGTQTTTWIDDEGRLRERTDDRHQFLRHVPLEFLDPWTCYDAWGGELAIKLITIGYNLDINRHWDEAKDFPYGSTGWDSARAYVDVYQRGMSIAQSSIAAGLLKDPDTPANWLEWAKRKGYDVAHLEHPQTAPAQETVTPAPMETVKQRRARYLAWHNEEFRINPRGALQRVYEREAKQNPKADRSNIGKDIEKARGTAKTQKLATAWTSQLVQDGKRKG